MERALFLLSFLAGSASILPSHERHMRTETMTLGEMLEDVFSKKTPLMQPTREE
jgi:hypothetical protein